MIKVSKEKYQFEKYDYKQIVTNERKISSLIDGYKNFGWMIDENINMISHKTSDSHANLVLYLKRNRNIINKMELTRLQRNYEFCLKELDHLEKSKTAKATAYALGVGSLGIACIVVFAFLLNAKSSNLILMGILVLLSILGIVVPYFLYQYMLNQRIKQTNFLIEEKQMELFDICEKGNRLL